MREWSKDSKTHVAHMSGGDFYGSEKSATMPSATSVSIEFVGADGSKKVLKKEVKLKAGEVIDASVMSCDSLRKFYKDQFEDAKKNKIMLSLHLKATMMKVRKKKKKQKKKKISLRFFFF